MFYLAAPRWYRGVALSVALVAGATLALSSVVLAGASDQSGHGVLDVSILPELPAPISVNGSVRNTGGIHGLTLPVGDHEVTFGAVPGYVSPPPQTVSIPEGGTVNVVGKFEPAGTLQVEVEPAELAPTVTVDGVERDQAPVLLELGEGAYDVCLEAIRGFEPVDCLQAEVMAGRDTTLTFAYSSIADDPKDEGDTDSVPLARVDEGLVALYEFSEGAGDQVLDVGGASEGMDLSVQDASAVTWTNDGLRFDRATFAATSGSPRAFYDLVGVTGEFSVEAWITPANTSQDGPARIATLSKDTKSQNFLLGQDRDSVQVRSRERKGNWRWNTPPGSLTTDPTHVVMTHRSDGTVSAFLDGELAGQETMSSGPNSWDDSYRFAIGMEFNDRREWLGTYHLVALYGIALDDDDVERNFAVGPRADGHADSSQGWDEKAAPSGEGEGEEPSDTSEGNEDRSEPAAEDAGTAQSLTQHGITWNFDQEYRYGTYANGDYWVVGPVTITDIDPSSVSAETAKHGSMINPSPKDGNRIGYGEMTRQEYDPELNVALDVSASKPLVVSPHSSLVSTISMEDSNERTGIHTAAVLTVVDEVPAANSFRPPYSGTDKTARFSTDDLRYDLLPRLEPVVGTGDITEMASEFERVWLDHVGKWRGRYVHPYTAMPDYGRDLAALLGQGSLMLMLDFSNDEKQELLINYVQIGIDFYGIVEDGGHRNWTPDGGHAQGRKWPILFAGAVLDDRAMANIGAREEVAFGEDWQTFYVSQEDVDRGVGYTQDDLGLPEWGIRHRTDPLRDDPSWEASYRRSSTANSFGGHVLSARIMGMQEEWNHDALFNYMDRYLDKEEQGSWRRFWQRPFTENMWDTYRPQY